MRLFQASEMQGSKVGTGWSFNNSENTKTVTINYDGHHQVHSFAAHIYSHDEVCLRGIECAVQFFIIKYQYKM